MTYSDIIPQCEISPTLVRLTGLTMQMYLFPYLRRVCFDAFRNMHMIHQIMSHLTSYLMCALTY